MNEDSCIEWERNRNKSGYGRVMVKGNGKWKTMLSHRRAWELMNGPIPKGMHVCHRCDNPACFRVSHLFLGTNADNMNDMKAKGRSPRQPGEANPYAKLNEAQVRDIIELRGQADLRTISDVFGITKASVSRIHLGKQWKHIDRKTCAWRQAPGSDTK